MDIDLTLRLRAGAEILLQCPEHVRLNRDHAPMDANLHRRADEANEAADEIERLLAARQWMSIDEQWPKHLSDVLVAYKCGKYVRIGVGEFDGTTVNDEGITIPYFKGIGGFEVTHWMPLPEPPEVTQ